MIFKTHHGFRALLVVCLANVGPVTSQGAVPQLLANQDHVAVNGGNLPHGSGQFKFAFVDVD
jgi:hypothetical protein